MPRGIYKRRKRKARKTPQKIGHHPYLNPIYGNLVALQGLFEYRRGLLNSKDEYPVRFAANRLLENSIEKLEAMIKERKPQ